MMRKYGVHVLVDERAYDYVFDILKKNVSCYKIWQKGTHYTEAGAYEVEVIIDTLVYKLIETGEASAKVHFDKWSHYDRGLHIILPSRFITVRSRNILVKSAPIGDDFYSVEVLGRKYQYSDKKKLELYWVKNEFEQVKNEINE